jgi:hypothetical protein
MVLYHTMILVLPRASCCHRVLQAWATFFLILVETHIIREFGGLWIFLDWQKATTGRASCICRRFKSFKSFKSFRGQQGQKNQCHRG